jgi:transposase InsO family protein
MKYVFIEENRAVYSVEMMSKVLGVSTSSYHNWRSGKYTKRAEHKQKMEQAIGQIYFEHSQRYGSPRIAAELQAQGISVSRHTVARYMNRMNIRSKRSRKYVVTTDSAHNYGYFDNVLDRRFNQEFACGAWVSDITYIPVVGGFLYHTAIIDLTDRKVIGWANSNGLTAKETTMDALKMAVTNRPPQKGLIFHSDRGVQYACKSFVEMATTYGMVQSMSRKANCWDNAVAESYFKTIKSELIYGNRLLESEKMKSLLFEYVEIYYNKKRRHSALGNLTIKEFEKNKYKNVA